MICANCNQAIYNVPTMEPDTTEYWGFPLTTFEYTLECEHCRHEYEIDAEQYYESQDRI